MACKAVQSCTTKSEKLWASTWRLLTVAEYTLHDAHCTFQFVHIATILFRKQLEGPMVKAGPRAHSIHFSQFNFIWSVIADVERVFSSDYLQIAKLCCWFLILPLIVAFPVRLNFNWLSVLESRTIKYLSVVRKVSIRYKENCNSLQSLN